MKRMLAAIAAVTLTAGLSLAAVAGPATADDPTPTSTSTPSPAASPDPAVAPPAVVTQAVAPSTFAVASTPYTPYEPLPACIPDSKVIYTYDSTTNSGVITVPSIYGSSNTLCQAFYVTATSWKYTTNSVWPQALDQAVRVIGSPKSADQFAISASGSYSYGATVLCGQGDIYASLSATDATLFPGAYLDGPGNPLPEHFLSSMGFQGPNPTYVQQNTSCYSPTTETGTATSTSQVCTGSNVTGTNTLTLSTVPGGVWTVKDGSHYEKTYPTGFGGDATPSQINVGDTYTITLADGSPTDTYSVKAYSTTWTPQDISTLDCTITTVIPADPSVTQATCNTATNTVNNNASLSIDLEAGLSYTVTGPAGFTTISNLTGTTGQTIVATAIPAGSYLVSVTNAAGYLLNPGVVPPTWPFTISVVNPVCGSIGNISATALAADCPQSAATGFTAATTGVPTITVTLNPNVVYTAHESLSNTNTVLTQTTTDVPAGEYTINVTLSTAGSAAGFVIPPADQSFGPFDLTAFCPPTLPAWHVGASGTNAVCTDGSTTDGVINLVHLTGQVPDETGKVTYTITNTVTNATIYSGNIATAVNVPAGSYNVHATVPAGDGISGNTGTNPYEDISVVIGSSSTNCDPSRLAFTGGTIAWFGFVLAGGMLFLGIAFLLMRRRGNRTAE